MRVLASVEMATDQTLVGWPPSRLAMSAPVFGSQSFTSPGRYCRLSPPADAKIAPSLENARDVTQRVCLAIAGASCADVRDEKTLITAAMVSEVSRVRIMDGIFLSGRKQVDQVVQNHGPKSVPIMRRARAN